MVWWKKSSQQADQTALPMRIAVNVALRELYRGVAGEKLHVADAAAGAMSAAGSRGDEGAASGMRRTAVSFEFGE